MLLHRAGGVEIALRPVALALAEMIFKNVYGAEEFKRQLPLNVIDGGDRWTVEGSQRAQDEPSRLGQIRRGKMQIEILKANCRVVKLIQFAGISPPE
jgi:hypothetical protein